jgi:hypothetical protein
MKYQSCRILTPKIVGDVNEEINEYFLYKLDAIMDALNQVSIPIFNIDYNPDDVHSCTVDVISPLVMYYIVKFATIYGMPHINIAPDNQSVFLSSDPDKYKLPTLIHS